MLQDWELLLHLADPKIIQVFINVTGNALYWKYNSLCLGASGEAPSSCGCS